LTTDICRCIVKYSNGNIGDGNAIAYHIYWGLTPRKEVRAMNLTVTIDWKFSVAIGAVAIGTIFAVKMDAPAAERVSIHAIDACKELAVAAKSIR
jgi:hypothetical protein